MSIFKRRQDPSNLPATGAGYSVLDAQLTVRGDIETEGTLRVDGRLDGSIRRADIVVIGTGDADILVSLAAGHRPTDKYVRLLRARLNGEFPSATFWFLPAT